MWKKTVLEGGWQHSWVCVLNWVERWAGQLTWLHLFCLLLTADRTDYIKFHTFWHPGTDRWNISRKCTRITFSPLGSTHQPHFPWVVYHSNIKKTRTGLNKDNYYLYIFKCNAVKKNIVNFLKLQHSDVHFFLFFPKIELVLTRCMCVCVCVFFPLETVSICSPDWPRIQNLPASVSQGSDYTCVVSPISGSRDKSLTYVAQYLLLTEK